MVTALDLDYELPVHEIFCRLWTGFRWTQIANAIGVPVLDLMRLSDRLRGRGIGLPRSAPRRYDTVPLPGVESADPA